MNIEARISDAVDDLRVAISQGSSPATALREIANEYDLKPEALLIRAKKMLGPLDEVAGKEAQRIEQGATEARMKQAIYEYSKSEAGVDIAKWLEERAGRRPTEQEIDYADELWMQQTLSNLMAGQ